MYDKNGNGLIDNGSELFGSGTRLASGERAGNGYLALADAQPTRARQARAVGLVCLDADGWVLGMNQAAQQMLGAGALREAAQNNSALHANDVFALPFEMLFDAGRAHRPCLEVPLWSGLRLNAQALLPRQSARRYGTADGSDEAAAERAPLKDIEVSLIQQAVREARGNVAEAARALGISRATVYRKLSNKKTG